jgi:hypothetical protein
MECVANGTRQRKDDKELTAQRPTADTFIGLWPYACLVDPTSSASNWEANMARLALFASVIALGMGTVVLHNSRHSNLIRVNPDITQNADGAFRDGLFQGKLAAERGIAPHVLSGRWATDADRASFRAGYAQGYAQVR